MRWFKRKRTVKFTEAEMEELYQLLLDAKNTIQILDPSKTSTAGRVRLRLERYL